MRTAERHTDNTPSFKILSRKNATGKALCGMRGLLAAGVILSAQGVSAVSASADINLTFGTYAADKPTETVRKFKPLLRALEAALTSELGDTVVIHTQIATDYDVGIANLVDREVDFARFGPASYVLAKKQSEGVSILAMEAVKGSKTFKGIIAVHEDSDIQVLTDLEGRTFAFGNKLSTIGRYLSQRELMRAGITSGNLKNFDYLVRHDRVGTAVANQQFDAGALKASTYKKLKFKKNLSLRKIAEFDNVTKPWIARDGLDGSIADALRQALLNMNDPKALKAIKKTGFLAGSDSDYDFVRKAIGEIAAF